MHQMIADLFDQVAHGEVRVVIDRTFPLSEAAEAHAYIESRQASGASRWRRSAAPDSDVPVSNRRPDSFLTTTQGSSNEYTWQDSCRSVRFHAGVGVSPRSGALAPHGDLC